MARRYYSDYASHCARHFFRYNSPVSMSEVHKLEREACEKAISKFAYEDRQILEEIYKSENYLPNTIVEVATEKNLDEHSVWALIGTFEFEVAKARGLV